MDEAKYGWLSAMTADKALIGVRIAIVQGSNGIGGAEVQGLRLARGLRDIGAEILCAGMGERGPLADRCCDMAIAWTALPRVESRFVPISLLRMRRAAKVLAAFQPSVVMPFTSAPNVLCNLFRAKIGARCTFWNQRDEGLHRFPSRLEAAALQSATDFIAIGPAARRHLSEDLGVADARISLIRIGVPRLHAIQGRDTWRRELRIGKDTLVAGMIANFHAPKDPATVVAAWPAVLERVHAAGQDAVLVMAGRHDEPIDALRSSPASAHIRMLGPQSDVGGLLSAFDLFIHSSRSEGGPNAVVEAMAGGLPVLASDIVAHRDALGAEETLCFFATGDAPALAERCAALLLDAALRQRLAHDNQARAESLYSVERMISATVTLINDAMKAVNR
jgi:glycosyltransferase involved in cell wall biosynthesis